MGILHYIYDFLWYNWNSSLIPFHKNHKIFEVEGTLAVIHSNFHLVAGKIIPKSPLEINAQNSILFTRFGPASMEQSWTVISLDLISVLLLMIAEEMGRGGRDLTFLQHHLSKRCFTYVIPIPQQLKKFTYMALSLTYLIDK